MMIAIPDDPGIVRDDSGMPILIYPLLDNLIPCVVFLNLAWFGTSFSNQ